MSEHATSSHGFTSDIENRMVSHMNEDHVDAMRDYCAYANVNVGNDDPQMVTIDQLGFDLSVSGKRVRFYFKEKCSTPVEVRKALVELAERARM